MSVEKENHRGGVFRLGLGSIVYGEFPDRIGKIRKIVGAAVARADFGLIPVFQRGIPPAVHEQGRLAGLIECGQSLRAGKVVHGEHPSLRADGGGPTSQRQLAKHVFGSGGRRADNFGIPGLPENDDPVLQASLTITVGRRQLIIVLGGKEKDGLPGLANIGKGGGHLRTIDDPVDSGQQQGGEHAEYGGCDQAFSESDCRAALGGEERLHGGLGESDQGGSPVSQMEEEGQNLGVRGGAALKASSPFVRSSWREQNLSKITIRSRIACQTN